MFESPHFLWRRFHKNYCKALALTRLQNYELIESEEDDEIIELAEIIDINYDLKILARHNSLVFLISALEAFLKDSFMEIYLQIQNEKSKDTDFLDAEIKYRHSFQNIEKTNKAFKWLCNDFQDINVDGLNDILQFRHKIVHESFYATNYSMETFKNNCSKIFLYAHYFNCFFLDNGYWSKILPKS